MIEEEPQPESITPAEATVIRVFDEGYTWAIDAADSSGAYTDEVWTHWNDTPLDRELAIEHAKDFAVEIGRPDLAASVRVLDQ